MADKPEFCKQCPINHVTTGYVPPVLVDSRELLVSEIPDTADVELSRPLAGGGGRWVTSLLKSARQNKAQFNIITSIGCRPPDNIHPAEPGWKHTSPKDAKAAVEYCRLHHLQPVIDSKNWTRIVAMGNAAMKPLTGRDGILTWRGSPLPLQGQHDRPRVMPTLGIRALMKGTTMFPVIAHDFRKSMNLPPEKYNLYASPKDLENFDYKRFVFDFEWDEWGNVTLAGLCAKPYEVIVTAWTEPYISIYKRIFENATDLYGHNIISADSVYFNQWGWNITANMWDTMLMQHLVQPDYRHGLGFVSSVFTNRVHWKGMGEDDIENEDGVETVPRAQWKTWNREDALPIALGGYKGCQSDDEAFRLYNARDNAANYDIIEPIEYLLDRYKLKSIYENVSRPVAWLCRDMGSHGLRLDQDRLNKLAESIDQDIIRYEKELPEGLAPYDHEVDKRVPAPPNTYKPAKRICKGNKKDKTSHDPTEIWFTQPDTIGTCPVCNTELKSPKLVLVKTVLGKALKHEVPWNSTDKVIAYAKEQGLKLVYNFKTKMLTADKSARKMWGKHETAFVTIDKLKKLSTMRKTFAKDSLRTMDRMYYNLLVHGTGEGRLSAVGARRGIDLNVQQLPKAFKKIFTPDTKDDVFLSFDIGQGENIVTTWLAKDWERWERINTKGYDEHSDLAQAIFNCDCTKDGPNDMLRQVGKRINHLKNYGGGPRKMHEVLVADGYNMYTEKDCREFDVMWRIKNAGTAKWQDETIELARVQGYLRNKFGRVRWFNTMDFAAKALAFLPASTLADCVLRMMIAAHASTFKTEIQNLNIQRAIDLPDKWDLRIMIHDDLTFHGPADTIQESVEKIRWIMTQPWAELDGLAFNVDGKWSNISLGEMKSLEV